MGEGYASAKRCVPALAVAGALAVLAPAASMALAVAAPGVALAQTEDRPQGAGPAETAPPSLETLLDRMPNPAPGPEPDPDPAGPRPAAILQGLNKTTARVSTIEAPIGAVARFGTLEITARACEKKPPTEPPESAAFLEIVDVRPDSPAVKLFAGWMFASSPAISALEHPVYDVWVIDCGRIAGAAATGPGGVSAAAPQGTDGDAATAQEPPVPQ